VVVFAAVALAATMLWYGTELMEEHHIPHWICQLVAALLFVLDVACLIFLMCVEVWKLLRIIWESLRPLEEKNAGN
jgi:predicted PurR-regulated permease PerM